MTFKKISKKAEKEALKKQEAETKRQRERIKNEIYPMLLSESLNIEDAKMVLGATAVAIRQAYNNLMVKVEVNELGLKTMIAKDSSNDRFRKTLEMIENENVSVALQLLDGLVEEITTCQRKESLKRPLSDLKVTLL